MRKIRINMVIAITMIATLLGTTLFHNTAFASVDSSQIQSLLNTKMTQSGYKPGGTPPSSYQKGSGCYGFCDMLCRYLYGHALPSQASNHYSFTNYSTNFTQVGSTLTIASGNLNASSLKSLFMQSKPGDVIQMDYTKSDGGDSLHTMMVYSVSDSGVVFYHAGSSKVYFGGLWTTNGSTMTWNSFLNWLKSSDDGISVYRSKQVTSTSVPSPSNTWINASCGSSATTNTSVTLTWGATNGSEYWLHIYKDGLDYINTDKYSATSYTQTYPAGDYTAWIEPRNSTGTGPLASVSFTVTEYDVAPTISDFRVSYIGYNNCEVSATIAEEGRGVDYYWIYTNEGSTFVPPKNLSSLKIINRIGNTLSSYFYTADSQQYHVLIGYCHGGTLGSLAEFVYTHRLPSYDASASYGNHTYYLYDHKYTRESADTFAINNGGNLVSINSADEQKVISDLIKQGSGRAYYTGGYRNSDNIWNWIDKSPFSYTNWFSGQPDNLGDCQDALIVYSDGWDDDSPNYKDVYGFIMEVVDTDVPISSATVYHIQDQIYSGLPNRPAIRVVYNSQILEQDTDYTVEYSDNINVGTATVTITGIGDYQGTKTVTFQIVANEADLEINSINAQSYTGTAIEPEITVSYCKKILVQDTDYTVEYSDNINVGTATVTVTGIGNYSGTGSKTFQITAKSLDNVNIGSIADKTYTGSAIKPSVTVKDGTKTLTANTDYTLSYSNNKAVGTATVTITGKGNYTGTRTTTFQIVPKATALTVSDIDDQSYTGIAIEPEITVKCGTKTLVQDTDYTVEYSDNINVGTATVTVTGIGNYSGTGSTTFEITAKSMAGVSISSIADKTYTGSAIKPSVTVKDGTKTLTANTDYTLSYSSNTDIGTATVTVTGKGNYTGTRTTTFKIVAANASDFVVSDIADQNYTGSAITPAVTVTFGTKTLVKDKDYVIVYSDNTNPGTATVTIVGTGNFTGTKVVTFNIVGNAPEPQPAAKFTWKKSSGKWYYVDQNGNKTTGFAIIEGTTYYFNSKGIMLTGWQQVDGVWYYFASSGVMKTGWQKISKKWYYFNDEGMMLTGVQTIEGKIYGFDTSGKMLTGWQKFDGIWYYFLSGGDAVTGWKKISKKWYWFYSDGSMASSETIRIGNKDYKFNSSGVCTNP